MSKSCNACLIEFPLENFYKAGTSWQAKCKSCYNKHIYSLQKVRRKALAIASNKMTAFQMIPMEKQIIILDAIALRKHMSKIALLVDIKADVLRRWKRSGIIA